MGNNYTPFVPHNDIGADDLQIVKEHENLIKTNKYSDAVSYLDNKEFSKGFRASLFNLIQNKIVVLQSNLLKKKDYKEEYFSETEPTDEEMGTKKIWMQPY